MSYKNKSGFSKACIRKVLGGIFSILLLVSLSGCLVQKKTDLQNLSLQGKVKQLIESQYLAVEKFGKAEKGDPYRMEDWDVIINFNEQGFYSKITYIDTHGKKIGYTDYLYNDQNDLIAEQNYDAEGGFSNKSVYLYDKKKKERVSEVLLTNSSDGLNGSVLVDYDDKDNSVTKSTYDSRGKLYQKEVQKLDKNRFPVETKIYNQENDLVNYRKEKFDKNGLRNELIVLSPDEEVLMKIFFKYDKKGNLISQEGIDETGQAFLPMRYEYEFDKQGNWTKRVEYVADKPSYLIEREFEY